MSSDTSTENVIDIENETLSGGAEINFLANDNILFDNAKSYEYLQNVEVRYQNYPHFFVLKSLSYLRARDNSFVYF